MEISLRERTHSDASHGRDINLIPQRRDETCSPGHSGGVSVSQTEQQEGEAVAAGPGQSLGALVRRALEHWSMHGVGNVLRAVTTRRRIVWALLLLVLLLLLLVQCAEVVREYLRYETVVSVDVRASDRLEFPAVSVCSLNAFRKSRVKKRLQEINDRFNIEFEERTRTTTETTTTTTTHLPPPPFVPRPVSEIVYLPDNTTEINYRIEFIPNILNESPPEPLHLEDPPVYPAQSNRRLPLEIHEISYTHLTNTNLSDFDNDHVDDLFPRDKPFDLDRPSLQQLIEWKERKVAMTRAVLTMLNDETDPAARSELGHDLEELLISCSWNLGQCDARNFSQFQSEQYGNCFTFEPDARLYTRAYQNTPVHGLALELYVDRREYLDYYTEREGFRVVVHDKSEPPWPVSRGLSMEPGVEVEVAVSATDTHRQEEPLETRCRSLSEEESESADMYYRFANFSRVSYSQQGCAETCYQRYVLEACGCVLSGSPHNNYIPFTGNNKVNVCNQLNQNLSHCYHKLMTSFYNIHLPCACPSKCYQREYLISSVSRSKWPAESGQILNWGKLIEHLVNETVDTGEEAASQMSRLVVYLSSTDVTVLTHHPAVEPFTMLSNIGGSIGMYLGISVIAVCEVVEFFFDIIVYPKEKKKKARHSSSSERLEAERGENNQKGVTLSKYVSKIHHHPA